MLIKHSTQGARSAMFPWAAPTPEQPAGPPGPSPQDIAIASLRRENDALRDEIAQLRAAWQEELDRIAARARDEAAQAHVRDDAKTLNVLAEALEKSRSQFEDCLLAVASQWATEIAALALEKLVAPRQGDSAWLARVIAQRLAMLDAAAIVALRLAPSDRQGVPEADIQACLPPGTRIEVDPTLSPGTARLQLRLGAIDIDPSEGIARLRDVLDTGAGNG